MVVALVDGDGGGGGDLTSIAATSSSIPFMLSALRNNLSSCCEVEEAGEEAEDEETVPLGKGLSKMEAIEPLLFSLASSEGSLLEETLEWPR